VGVLYSQIQMCFYSKGKTLGMWRILEPPHCWEPMSGGSRLCLKVAPSSEMDSAHSCGLAEARKVNNKNILSLWTGLLLKTILPFARYLLVWRERLELRCHSGFTFRNRQCIRWLSTLALWQMVPISAICFFFLTYFPATLKWNVGFQIVLLNNEVYHKI
jgi:hypothetical protein